MTESKWIKLEVGRFSSKTVATLLKASDVFIELAQIDLTEIKEEQH